MAIVEAVAQTEDMRELVKFPPAAEVNLRLEMRNNLRALNDILSLVADGKLAEASVAAETELGQSAMGKHRSQPMAARPGPHMPQAMHAIGMDGHKAASEFARIAATGDRDKTLAALPSLTTACVACHYSYRAR
ncbi:MAG: cytochrome c [Betaproteobacteria bacterium]|uniref:Cytochrome c n=1 Tax=Candidatus Proximibacter danicus TaxID=2954365 RepID=A0A9D7K159_9PROT|nr:cytochrome c [Candidatus Proximibacter danicus]MBK9444767.1 cytochrome c [Betaproteobacteria bacterium]